MGKRKFNEKGRQVVETIQDDSETKQVNTEDMIVWLCLGKAQLFYLFQIKLDFATPEYGGNDATNALVLPSKKRDSKIKKATDQTNVTRILSKKKRKLLEKIVDKKKKKEGVGSA